MKKVYGTNNILKQFFSNFFSNFFQIENYGKITDSQYVSYIKKWVCQWHCTSKGQGPM